MSPSNDSILDATLQYADRGWHLVPLRRVGRGWQPCFKTGRDHEAASNDPARIKQWHKLFPGCAWAVACGLPGGPVVLDVDRHSPEADGVQSLKALVEQHPELKAALQCAPVVRTPGGGFHYYFAAPADGTLRGVISLRPGLDLLGKGRLAVLPPSQREDGRYEWVRPPTGQLPPLPPVLVQLLDDQKSGRPKAQAPAGEAAADGNGSGKIHEGQRNVALTRLAGRLRRNGLGEEEIYAALEQTNAQRCVPPLPADEVRSIAHSVAKYPSGRELEVDTPSVAVVKCLADVEPQPVRWLWNGRIPLGKLTLLVGDPGLGKSFLSLDIVARTTRGLPWPDDPDSGPPIGDVLLLNAEDDPADTIRPRLDAAGADVRRVHILEGVKYIDPETLKPTFSLFNLVRDLDALEGELKKRPETRLVVIDPVSAFLGATDSHNNAEVRGMLAPLAALAARYGVALVIISHLNKNAALQAIYRATGSLAFPAAARTAWLVAKDQDDEARRLLLCLKNNLAKEPPGLAFRITRGAVEWLPGPVTMTADAALAVKNDKGGHKPGPEPEARSQAVDWLRELLKDGPLESARVKDEGKAAGYTWRTLHRAKDVLGIQPYREQFGGKWMWKLPEGPALSCQPPEDTENLASWHDRQNPRKNSDSEPGTIGTCQDNLSWHDSSNPPPGTPPAGPAAPGKAPPEPAPGTPPAEEPERLPSSGSNLVL